MTRKRGSYSDAKKAAYRTGMKAYDLKGNIQIDCPYTHVGLVAAFDAGFSEAKRLDDEINYIERN